MNNLQQYSDLADSWWDASGPFQDLIHLIPARFKFFDQMLADWSKKKVLDLGCGGGFMAELLAKRGAQVVGVDPSEPLLGVARSHASEQGLCIDYRVGTGEALPIENESVDVVVCVDVLEHVTDVDQVLKEVRRVLKPGGLFFYDTINRTFFSFLWMIVALEWISGRIPRGTHDWRKFIPPEALLGLLNRNGFDSIGQAGIVIRRLLVENYKLTPRFEISNRKSGVYVGAAVRK